MLCFFFDFLLQVKIQFYVFFYHFSIALHSWYKVVMAFFLLSLTVYGGFMGLLHAGTILIAAAANSICIKRAYERYAEQP